MSATEDPKVALLYARSEATALLFRLVVPSFMSLGSDLTWLSAFPHEREFCYPPLTFLRPLGALSEFEHGGVRYTVVDCEASFPS